VSFYGVHVFIPYILFSSKSAEKISICKKLFARKEVRKIYKHFRHENIKYQFGGPPTSVDAQEARYFSEQTSDYL
jgi:hypothetical protein